MRLRIEHSSILHLLIEDDRTVNGFLLFCWMFQQWRNCSNSSWKKTLDKSQNNMCSLLDRGRTLWSPPCDTDFRGNFVRSRVKTTRDPTLTTCAYRANRPCQHRDTSPNAETSMPHRRCTCGFQESPGHIFRQNRFRGQNSTRQQGKIRNPAKTTSW